MRHLRAAREAPLEYPLKKKKIPSAAMLARGLMLLMTLHAGSVGAFLCPNPAPFVALRGVGAVEPGRAQFRSFSLRCASVLCMSWGTPPNTFPPSATEAVDNEPIYSVYAQGKRQ